MSRGATPHFDASIHHARSAPPDTFWGTLTPEELQELHDRLQKEKDWVGFHLGSFIGRRRVVTVIPNSEYL